jgi:hypothetical protein
VKDAPQDILAAMKWKLGLQNYAVNMPIAKELYKI